MIALVWIMTGTAVVGCICLMKACRRLRWLREANENVRRANANLQASLHEAQTELEALRQALNVARCDVSTIRRTHTCRYQELEAKVTTGLRNISQSIGELFMMMDDLPGHQEATENNAADDASEGDQSPGDLPPKQRQAWKCRKLQSGGRE